MKIRMLIAGLCMSLTGCVVVPAATTGVNHPHGGPPGQAKRPGEHPHGGPPGQMKKHHAHAAECGHLRVKHEGVWIYSVDGKWWKHESGETWVVVEYHESQAGKGKGNGKGKGKKK